MKGHVYLVGAGCGGPELITVRGLELLRRCQVVVYDELIDPVLLEEVPSGAERIPVGKRAGSVSTSQEYINSLLVERGRAGKLVVRLKGGDPFVFGRGGEELMALREAGISASVVPGISSALAIPMEAGIPVTHRAVSRSVHIVTAHSAEKALPEQLPELAAMDGTLVFLMGLHAVERLSRSLIENGKSPATPVTVCSGGNSPHPAEARGTLSDIAERVRTAGVLPPAIVVVGPVAEMDLRDPEKTALSGVTAGLTGTRELQNKLAAMLNERGIRTRRIQRTRCRELPAEVPWTELESGRWLVFTSKKGVEYFFRRLTKEGIDLRRLFRCRFAVIGRATGRALAQKGIRADLCPSSFTGEELGRALSERMEPGEQAVLLDSAKGSGVVKEILSENEIPCVRISLYDIEFETVPETGSLQYLFFGSAGAVRALADSGYRPDESVTLVCIGPVCAAACEERFHRKPLVPEEISAEAMVRAVLSDSRAADEEDENGSCT